MRRIQRKNAEQIVAMRRAGLVVAEAHRVLREAAQPGVTTGELDQLGREVLARSGATSSFLNYGADWGYPPFPGVACISVNDEVVHGIPGERTLAVGDLVSIDFGAIVAGWHGDAAITCFVGEPTAAAAALSEATREALWAGIAAARVGGRIGDISAAIAASSRAAGEYGIVRGYTGHGIGTEMHMHPDVPNYGRAGTGPRIGDGVCLAIEPMLIAGSPDVYTLPDEWTVATKDGSLAAHWEHTVAITKRGVWVLTAPDGGESELARLDVPFAPLGD